MLKFKKVALSPLKKYLLSKVSLMGLAQSVTKFIETEKFLDSPEKKTLAMSLIKIEKTKTENIQ